MSSTSSSPSPTGSTGAPPAATGSGSSPAHPPPPGPPYPPKTAALGLTPSILPDIPTALVLALLFLLAAAANMAVFTRNRRRSYKFVFSGLLFLFCMARVAALALRCAWAVHPRSVRLGIASQVFTAAGVLILFVTNLVFAQRVVRACHPFFGWGRGVTGVFWGLFGSAVVVLVAVVTVTVQGFFVRDEGVKGVDRGVQLGCATYLAVYAFLPVPLVMLAAVVPRKTRIDKFGEGHFRTKFALLTVTASLLAAGAVFRAVVAYAARPVDRPAWFHGKACYYCFNFVVELLVVYIYALSRFDKRFHIPDGSSAPGHYSCIEYGSNGRGGGSLVSNGDLEKSKRNEKPSGSGEPGLGEGLETMVWPPPAAKTPSRGSSKKSSLHSLRAASSCYGAGSSESSQVRQDNMEWMTRAMRELYGDNDEGQKSQQESGGWLSSVKIGGLSDFGDDYGTGLWASVSRNDGREQVKSPAFTEWSF